MSVKNVNSPYLLTDFRMYELGVASSSMMCLQKSLIKMPFGSDVIGGMCCSRWHVVKLQ
jgi:hypothetical protein